MHLHRQQETHTSEKDLWRAHNIASHNLQKFHSCLDPVHRPEFSEYYQITIKVCGVLEKQEGQYLLLQIIESKFQNRRMTKSQTFTLTLAKIDSLSQNQKILLIEDKMDFFWCPPPLSEIST